MDCALEEMQSPPPCARSIGGSSRTPPGLLRGGYRFRCAFLPSLRYQVERSCTCRDVTTNEPTTPAPAPGEFGEGQPHRAFARRTFARGACKSSLAHPCVSSA